MQKPITHGWLKFAMVASLSLLTLLLYNLGTTSQLYNYKQHYEVEWRDGRDADAKLKEALKRATRDKKIILIWHPDNDNVRADAEVAKTAYLSPVESCGLCEFTADKGKIQDADTAVVVFLYRYVTPEVMPPQEQRRSDQLYIWWTKESPTNLKNYWKYNFEYADSIQFNLTMSNRRDSDIYSPYGRGVDMLPALEKNFTKILESKSRLAIAVVSNCATPHAALRMGYLSRLLAAGFQLDSLGRCFGSATSKKDKETFLESLKAYKFYFAFENSYHCRDYITEKVFQNGFGANAVPVVWGALRNDYMALLPSKSYVYAEDFSSLGQLARYLNYLDKNDTAYQEYFRWRTKKPEDFQQPGRKTDYCQICRIAHGINVDDIYHPDYSASTHTRPLFDTSVSPARSVKSLRSWMYDTENIDCLQPNVHATL